MVANPRWQPRDLKIDSQGDSWTFHGTCSTTHEADYLIRTIEIFSGLLPSTRTMVRGDIYFEPAPKPDLVEEMMKAIAP